MKTLKLVVPDDTYDVAVQRAKMEGMDIEFYCSTFLTERLNQNFRQPDVKKSAIPPTKSETTFAVGPKLPDTIEQIYFVCRYVWQNKMEYSEAVRMVSKDLCIEETTVRDKCTRRISFLDVVVNTDYFQRLLANPEQLIEHLSRKFPKFSSEIPVLFKAIMAVNN
jgi:hypothetical protein